MKYEDLVSSATRVRPIVIGGCARSGTTLVLSILSSHPDAFSIPFETKVFTPRTSMGEIDHKKAIDMTFLYQYLDSNDVFRDGKVWIEKTPKNLSNYAAISDHLGDRFTFINIIRDGRDVITSMHPTSPNSPWVSKDRWVRAMQIAKKYGHKKNFVTVKYEELVQNFNATIEVVQESAGLRTLITEKNWHENAKVRTFNSLQGEVENIKTTAIQRWKRDQSSRAIVDDMMEDKDFRDMLHYFGYE